jgi:hypothetical protein
MVERTTAIAIFGAKSLRGGLKVNLIGLKKSKFERAGLLKALKIKKAAPRCRLWFIRPM